MESHLRELGTDAHSGCRSEYRIRSAGTLRAACALQFDGSFLTLPKMLLTLLMGVRRARDRSMILCPTNSVLSVQYSHSSSGFPVKPIHSISRETQFVEVNVKGDSGWTVALVKMNGSFGTDAANARVSRTMKANTPVFVKRKFSYEN